MLCLVEPNLDMHQKYELIDYKIAIESRADIVVLFGKYNNRLRGIKKILLDLDFCGVTD